jgi:hypothetical protein
MRLVRPSHFVARSPAALWRAIGAALDKGSFRFRHGRSLVERGPYPADRSRLSSASIGQVAR